MTDAPKRRICGFCRGEGFVLVDSADLPGDPGPDPLDEPDLIEVACPECAGSGLDAPCRGCNSPDAKEDVTKPSVDG